MSVEAVSWVLKHTQEMSPARRLVLVTAADYAGDGGWCWAALESLAVKAGCDEQTARRTMSEAVARGWLVEATSDDAPVEWLRIRADRRPRCYRFTLHGVGTVIPRDPLADANEVSGETTRGITRGSNGVSGVIPDPNKTRLTTDWARAIRYPVPEGATPTSTPHRWKLTDGGHADLIWDTLVEVCGLDTSQMTDDARGSLNRSVKQLRAVGADPPEIRRRASRYRSGNAPGIPANTKLTHRALASHWPELGTAAPKPAVEAPHEHQWEPHFKIPGREVCAGCRQTRETP